MPTLTPVDFDPFAPAQSAGPRLTPVDYDPFAAAPAKYGADTPLKDMKDLDMEGIHQVLRAAGPEVQKEITPEGMGKAAAIGVPKAILGLADLPRLLESGLNQGNEALVRAGKAQPRDRTEILPLPPSSKELQAKIEGVTGPWYEPKNDAERGAETLGGFALGAAGRLPGLGERVLTQVLAPYMTSESLGRATSGTAIEPYARFAGAVLAGPIAGRAASGLRPGAPSIEELKDASRSVYGDKSVRSMPVPPNDATALGVNIVDKLDNAGFDALNAPTPFKRAEYLADLQNPTVGDIHAVRKKLSTDAQGKIVSGPAEANASRDAKREVDSFLDNYDPRLKDANANYAAAKRAETVQGKLDQAEYRSQAANSGKNIDNATRQRMVDILTNPRLRAGFSPEEIAQLERIVEGTAVGNTARHIGNVLGGGGGLGQLAAMGAAGGAGAAMSGGTAGLAAAAIPPILGTVAKGVENASTARQVRILDEMIRNRSPLGQAAAAGNPVDPAMLARVRLLLQGTAGLPRLEGNQ